MSEGSYIIEYAGESKNGKPFTILEVDLLGHGGTTYEDRYATYIFFGEAPVGGKLLDYEVIPSSRPDRADMIRKVLFRTKNGKVSNGR